MRKEDTAAEPTERKSSFLNSSTPQFLNSNILVVRLSAMGDVLHALPAVATLKSSFPRARITWAIEPRWAVLLRDNPHVDRVVELDLQRWRRRWWAPATWRELGDIRRELRAARYDLAIDFQGLLKSALVASTVHPNDIIGFHKELLREPASGLLYSSHVSSASRHVVDQNLDLVAAAGATTRRIEFPLPAYPAEGELPDSDFVLASPIAGWKAKQWPAAYYAEMARRLRERHGWHLVINCAPAERDEAQAIVALAPPRSCLLNVTSLEGLIGVTRLARAVVGVDSGPLHLAAALGKPGVALFGPTDPSRNGPYGSSFAVLRFTDAVTTYRRLSTISSSMQALGPDLVFQALEMQLSQHSTMELRS